jgi:hypothetical protein
MILRQQLQLFHQKVELEVVLKAPKEQQEQ